MIISELRKKKKTFIPLFLRYLNQKVLHLGPALLEELAALVFQEFLHKLCCSLILLGEERSPDSPVQHSVIFAGLSSGVIYHPHTHSRAGLLHTHAHAHTHTHTHTIIAVIQFTEISHILIFPETTDVTKEEDWRERVLIA